MRPRGPLPTLRAMRAKRLLTALTVLAIVASLAAASALAFRAEDGGWRGTTTQGLPISFRVNDSSTLVKRIRFHVKTTCPLGTARYRVASSGTVQINGRRFSVSATNVLSQAQVKGRFIGRRTAKGILRWKSFEGSLGGYCRSGRVGWTARAR